MLSKARYCRCKIGIVATALDDRVFLRARLVFPIQIEPRLDRDRAMDTDCLRVRGYKGTGFSAGIRVQFEARLYAVGCEGIASRRRLETPAGRLSFGHMECEIAAQLFRAVKSG